MKHIFILPAAFALALTGCHQAAAPAAADAAKNDAAPPAESTSASAQPFQAETGSLVASDQVPLLEQINRENIKVAKAAVPAIVRVIVEMAADPHVQFFGNQMPFHFHFSPDSPHGAMPGDQAYGSGVIISHDGYIVTNNHVIENAKSVKVQLADRRTLLAHVVATDSFVDVAVLKVDATDLPVLPWGDSDKLQIGEQVFAIGNPFNFGDSMSKGIVSASGRNLGASAYEDFIQTDAAINPGNSGGALVNIHGELVGISAAIATSSRYNMGVGFAIPSNLVRFAVEGLIRDHKLVRGYLGVKLPRSVDEGVISQLNLKSDAGALLVGVEKGSPADKAGLKSFDFITQVDGHKIDDIAGLKLVVAQIPVGREVPVSFIRNGEEQSVKVKIAEYTTDQPTAQLGFGDNDGPPAPAPAAHGSPTPPQDENALSGLQVTDLTLKSREQFGIDESVTHGVVVVNVEDGTSAADKGLARGDVIESTNIDSFAPLDAAKKFNDLAKTLKPKQGVVLLIRHGRESGGAEDNRGSSFVFLAPAK